ncbi:MULTISPECIES: PTS sugar transporter subunit IIB [unclassified Clostridioides]|uniref:PTS sugar transporter subunit IIB n=1 Tax=unclassified Clostridioides TaxID=2635829 RepID=UPI0006BBF533|nr:PTS ascorbate transporter subunit IIB [Clostridioides difficile]MCC0691067.1 PTS sugar transporter subunit IIB [Clostridioides sp. ZZV14-6387]KPI50230.1 PTS ascorbate transporter subunit IIB [Clostridioides difficile]MCI9975033.1 PTS sugar transporter subunit IIB [Clostridioides difficile]MDB3085253.1 PTS ascorbate transporter subunit IIB [Clostridioides difficile]
MKILAVCGFGVGSSMVLKMTIQKVLKQLDIEGEVENTDINSARGTDCDCIFTSQELLNELKGTCNVPVYPVKKYMDLSEVKEVVQTFLNDKK